MKRVILLCMLTLVSCSHKKEKDSYPSKEERLHNMQIPSQYKPNQNKTQKFHAFRIRPKKK